MVRALLFVDVPRIYGELAIQLAAALHNFLITKYLETKPLVPEPEASSNFDEIPF